MTTLKLDTVRDVLPELDELRPILDHLIARSEPDPARTWSGSGRLGALGRRLVPELAAPEAAALAGAEAAHLGRLFEAVGLALTRLAAGDEEGAALAFLEAAALEEARDRPDRAEAYAAAAHRTVRHLNGPSASLALRRWARAGRARGDLARALKRYLAAHEAAAALGDRSGAAEAAIGAGNVLEEQGRWPDAEEWYRKALAEVGEDAPERLHALVNLHIVTRSRGELDGSEPWLEEAERTASLVDPEGAAPFLLNARGQLAMARRDFSRAETHLRQALGVARDTRAAVTIRLNLAETLLAQNRTLDAAEEAREAEREAIRAGLVPKLPEVYRLLGRIASQEGESDAFVFFEHALALVRDRGLPALEEALTLQAYADAEHGDPHKAKELRERARDLLAGLGIAHLRDDWADTFGGPPSDGETAGEYDAED